MIRDVLLQIILYARLVVIISGLTNPSKFGYMFYFMSTLQRGYPRHIESNLVNFDCVLLNIET